jgi:type I restriction-modification system DNA methylase subunit
MRCHVNSDNSIKLPNEQLDRSVYLNVKKELTALGGKWVGGKTQAFVFNFNPTELLDRLQNGETDIKKQIQFFPTPKELAKTIVELAEIANHHHVLEPSAGQGAIVSEILSVIQSQIHVCEIDPTNRKILANKFGDKIYAIADDFLNLQPSNLHEYYDRIVANPPFSKGQDILHIKHMYECLKPGGVLVSFSGTGWLFNSMKRSQSFREWVSEVHAEIISVERPAFSESGTEIPTLILKIRKVL